MAAAATEQPVVVQRPAHAAGCGCLACADWRAWRRSIGLRGSWPRPAKDWRGVQLNDGNTATHLEGR
jgi:hypothetical protein